MQSASFLPSLSASDILNVTNLIQRSYSATAPVSPEEHKAIQTELFNIQKRPEAWGLVIPLLEYQDPNVQFFGAHTAQIKLARDWDTIPSEHYLDIRNVILELTGRSISTKTKKVILRKLFVALTSLALRLAVGNQPLWPDWINFTVSSLVGYGASRETTFNFLAIVAEEVTSSDLLKPAKAQMHQIMLDFTRRLTEAVVTSVIRPDISQTELVAALKCLESWIGWGLPADDLTPLIPHMLNLLSFPLFFVSASTVLQEILTSSSLADGGGVETVTKPLLSWVQAQGRAVFQDSVADSTVDETGNSLCKLLVALGDHSTYHIAEHIIKPEVQTFLHLLLSFTSLPGYYGVDEEESEMTLSFWFKLQEEMWNVDYGGAQHFESDYRPEDLVPEPPQWDMAVEVYLELIKVLKVKVTWPPISEGKRWMKDQRQRFMVYRRDVGDTLINAYYVLRDKLLKYYIDGLLQELAEREPNDPWESIEATLHCICSVQEAVPIMDNPHLAQLFSSNVLNSLPSQGGHIVRQTALNVIAAYSTWFTSQGSALLMRIIPYVINSLNDSILCLTAATALRDLCDANRAKLTSHIAEFGQLYANIGNIPDSEKPKVIQSIASVIEALPPEDGVQPVDAMITPVVAKAFEALSISHQLPEDALNLCLHQLEAITCCARGLTKNSDNLFILDELSPQESEALTGARSDPRMVKLREQLLELIRRVLEIWSTHASVYDAIGDLLKSITALPNDTTLITLPPTPLFELICAAGQKEMNAVWLTQAGRLIFQLNPPSLLSLKPVPLEDVMRRTVISLPPLLQEALSVLGAPGGMDDNPDIVKAFFECLEIAANNMISIFFLIPQGLFGSIMDCAIAALSVQERYSFVKSCIFLNTLMTALLNDADLKEQADIVMAAYGRRIMQAILFGIAAVAPRSALQNLVELLANIVSKRRQLAKDWMPEIVFSDSFVPTKASLQAKKSFCDKIVASKSTRRSKEAAHQFALVARGLDGSSFGYASVSM